MAILEKRSGTQWIAASLAAGLLVVMSGSSAQDSSTRGYSGSADKAEKSGKPEKGGKSDKGEKATVTAHLSGDKEVPSIETKATGKSTIRVDENKSVSGKVIVENMTPTAAHIHQGAPDKNGPVVIPLEQTSANTFTVPPNTRLTDDQFAAFKEGNLYINVHSKKYPSGEIRAHMKP